MTKEIFENIKEILKYISTPTGLSYSGDTTLTNEDSDMIIEYIEDFQQRIDKAIEYIKEFRFATTDFSLHSDRLLSILQDKEVK